MIQRLFIPLILACTLPACAGALAPQVTQPISTEKMVTQGAMADASRAYGVGFYANPGGRPEYFDVNVGLSGIRVAGAQWTTELALTLNQTVARVGRFDERFRAFSVHIFENSVRQGDKLFAWRPDSEHPNFGGARVATLRLLELTGADSGGDGVGTKSALEVSVGDRVHVYACEVIARKQWMSATMACLGEKILGDPGFWAAVANMP